MTTAPPPVALPYQELWDKTSGETFDDRLDELWNELYDRWLDLYEDSTGSLGVCDSVKQGTFVYVHDTRPDYPEAFDFRTMVDDRVIFVAGTSIHVRNAREPFGMRAPLCLHEFGVTEKECPFDRGHFIAHSLGGFDQVGLFPQVRDVNQGRNEEGKRYVAMEAYARRHPGTFMFSRPIYGDNTRHPFWVEFGILKADNTFVVEVFPNRYTYTPYTGPELQPEWFRQKLAREAIAFERSTKRHVKRLEQERAEGRHF